MTKTQFSGTNPGHSILQEQIRNKNLGLNFWSTAIFTLSKCPQRIMRIHLALNIASSLFSTAMMHPLNRNVLRTYYVLSTVSDARDNSKQDKDSAPGKPMAL